MWIRGKRLHNRWGDWEFWPGMTVERLIRIRAAVRTAYVGYIAKCLGAGEQLVIPDKTYPAIKTPLGFTPNDFVRLAVESVAYGVPIDFFNIRWFFQTCEAMDGDYESGPHRMGTRLANVLTEPAGGWEMPSAMGEED